MCYVTFDKERPLNERGTMVPVRGHYNERAVRISTDNRASPKRAASLRRDSGFYFSSLTGTCSAPAGTSSARAFFRFNRNFPTTMTPTANVTSAT